MKNLRRLTEAALASGLDEERLVRFVSYTWVCPAEDEPAGFDDEDIARAALIRELQEDLGVNDAGVPIILHLLDQIHRMRAEVRRIR